MNGATKFSALARCRIKQKEREEEKRIFSTHRRDSFWISFILVGDATLEGFQKLLTNNKSAEVD